jgi:hypothetical protein
MKFGNNSQCQDLKNKIWQKYSWFQEEGLAEWKFPQGKQKIVENLFFEIKTSSF